MLWRFSLVLSLCVAGLAICGCGSNQPKAGTTVQRPGTAPVTYVKDDDPKMVAAINQARMTVDEFIAVLKQPKPGQSGFGVKAPIKDGKRLEHMWISPVRFGDGHFTGMINNEPLELTSVKLGDEFKIAKAEISDWMYVEGGKLIGGYTIRVVRDGMSANEREKFVKGLGLVID